MQKNKKKIIWLSILLLLIISISLFNKIDLLATKEFLKRKLDPKVFAVLQVFGDIERSSKKLNNDYNVKFIPYTQFLNVDLKKISLNDYFSNNDVAGYANHLKIKVRQVFYIDKYLNEVLFLTSNGKLFFNDYQKIISDGKLKTIKTNLQITTALDLLINKKKFIYLV